MRKVRAAGVGIAGSLLILTSSVSFTPSALADEGAAVTAFPPAAGVPTGPEPEGLSAGSPTDDVMPVVAERIFDMGLERGFAGQQTDYASRSITVYWADEVPADISEYATSNPFGVEVELVEGVAHSRAEGEGARDRLMSSPLAAALGIVAISVPSDGAGLVVGTTRAALTQEEVDSLRATAGFDEVMVEYGVAASEGYAQRNNDAPAWKGGIRMRHMTSSGVARCTSGFAVIKNGTGRLLGARHCNTPGNAKVRDGNGDLISEGGTYVQERAAVDSLLIDPKASPATTPKIYRGGYASSTLSTVKNWYSNWPGDPVCSSGASTGEHCGTVYDDNQNIYFNGAWVNVIQVKAPSGSIMGGQGDSGASMFKKITGGVQARGVLLGPDADYAETTKCGTVNPDVGSIRCSRFINYVPISTILNKWGASLEVG